MPLFQRVRRLLDVRDDRVLHECRHCGTTLDAETEACDACGSENVARYVIE